MDRIASTMRSVTVCSAAGKAAPLSAWSADAAGADASDAGAGGTDAALSGESGARGTRAALRAGEHAEPAHCEAHAVARCFVRAGLLRTGARGGVARTRLSPPAGDDGTGRDRPRGRAGSDEVWRRDEDLDRRRALRSRV